MNPLTKKAFAALTLAVSSTLAVHVANLAFSFAPSVVTCAALEFACGLSFALAVGRGGASATKGGDR